MLVPRLLEPSVSSSDWRITCSARHFHSEFLLCCYAVPITSFQDPKPSLTGYVVFLREPLKTQKENINIFAVSSEAEFDALKKRSETCTKNADLFRADLFRTSIHPTLGPKLAQANGSMSNRVKWSKASSETRKINENVSSLIQSCSMYMFKLSNPTTSGPAQDDQRPPQRKEKSRTSKWTKHESTENWMCKHAQTWVVSGDVEIC